MGNSFLSGMYIIIIAVLIVVIMLLYYVIGMANKLTRSRNKVRELESDVDVALAKRFDLLKKQYEIVKGYMTYESRTILDTVKIRRGMSITEKTDAVSTMDKMEKNINATFEAYPALQAGKNFETLQNSCTDAEEHLQAARRLYNAGVTNYNNLCTEFPSSIIASITGHRPAEYFSTEDSRKADYEFRF